MTRKIIVMAGSQVFTTIIRNESLFPFEGTFQRKDADQGRTQAAPHESGDPSDGRVGGLGG